MSSSEMLGGGSHPMSMVQPFVPLIRWLAMTFCGISGTPGSNNEYPLSIIIIIVSYKL